TNMRKKKLTIGLSVGMGVVLAIILVFCCLWISKDNSIIFWKRKKKAHKVVEEFLKNYGSLAPTRYHYSDIKKITHSFKHKIGQGGYGGVYKGKLLDGRLVAVKLLDKAKGDGEEFINEVASISRTSHVNIVSLVGFCFDGSKRALIYEFMVNGSLEKRRAQEEINSIIGKDRLVDASDIEKLVYLQAIVKETLRLYPPAPLSTQHEAIEDCTVAGYHVPAGTWLITNILKIQRDPRIWSNLSEFQPERFLTTQANVNLKGQHFEFIPFGSGRQ
ncbi:Cytochrome p450, partial [Thalictrum thalictroides]